MKTFKKYAGLLMMLTLLVGFSSCQDEEELEDRMMGRLWVGDVGMDAENGEPIYSEFKFDSNGFGREYQYYQSDGDYYRDFPFQWYWSNSYSGELVLDYGRNGISYMNSLDIRNERMTGVFYFSRSSDGFSFKLDMR